MESIYLVGSESVERAGNSMRSAAEEMIRAANTISAEFEQQRRFMDDWLMRLESLLRDKEPRP